MKMYLRVCKRCGKEFYSKTWQRQYHEECAAQQDKENKMKSQRAAHNDTFFGRCQQERYRYNNFKKSKSYLNAADVLQKEYDALFNRFKAQVVEYRIRLNDVRSKRQPRNSNTEGTLVMEMFTWYEEIKAEREKLEEKLRKGAAKDEMGR